MTDKDHKILVTISNNQLRIIFPVMIAISDAIRTGIEITATPVTILVMSPKPSKFFELREANIAPQPVFKVVIGYIIVTFNVETVLVIDVLLPHIVVGN